MKTVLCLAALFALVAADVYMHNPRGSNNRVDEQNNAPANRLFDSQNNNEAGYNRGEEGEMMEYYAESKLMVMWTAQHGCGDNVDTTCEIILQYRCDDLMRDGTSTDQPEEDLPTRDSEPSEDRGRHEPYANWLDCDTRNRNEGLYIADRNLGDTAASTRQNNGGGRSGYECAEERDYYPYWHPTYWKDIVVMTSNISRCEYYQQQSQNVIGKGYCSSQVENNPTECTDNGGTWNEAPAFGIDPPQCVLAPFSRVNVHGNAQNLGDPNTGNEQAHFNMTIPNEPSNACVLRVRYNITSFDFDGWTIDSFYNGDNSPIKNNPDYKLNGDLTLQLNFNTNQGGRTFEDRSHVFKILAKSETVDSDVYNLNVRGKRGNNAATYPSTEYDYVPTRFHIYKDDWVHWQWTGSENNNNGNDRNNAVQMATSGINKPIEPFSNFSMWPDVDTAMRAATSCGSEDENLQDVTPYCNVGLVQYTTVGEYVYMSTKNQAFSNRDQRGYILVEDRPLGTGAIVAIAVGSAAVVGGAAAGAVVYRRRKGMGALPSGARF